MQMQGEKRIPAGQQATWDALNDPEVLKACIPGCESLVQSGDNQFDSVVAMRIGPVSAKFKGALALNEVNEPESYSMDFEGQGGVAGFGKGSAVVRLVPVDADATMLSYEADAQVGGKLAQIGSRLVDSAAAKITNQFFDQFTAYMATQGGSEAATESSDDIAVAGVTTASDARGASMNASIDGKPAGASTATQSANSASRDENSSSGGSGRWLRFVILALGALVLTWMFGRGGS